MATSATLDTTEFVTDRGRHQLPAWRVVIDDVPDPIWALDPGVKHTAWSPTVGYWPAWRSTTAVVDSDGRTVSMCFSGSPRQYADYPDSLVEAFESVVRLACCPCLLTSVPPGHVGHMLNDERSLPC